MIGRRFFSTTQLTQFKRKLLQNEMYRSLPRVPTTQFLRSSELTNDILFSGYRPMTYPVKENPLFMDRSRNNKPPVLKQQQETKDEFTVMTGPRGTGGIVSGGVNGTWRFNPRVPNKLLPYNIWSTSTMGMEYFPEWQNVPNNIIKKLKPYDLENK